MIQSNKKKIFTEYPRTRTRLVLFSLFVLMGFALISAKIAFLASKENQTHKRFSDTEKIPSRLNISDRNGYILATNLEGVSVYIRPEEIQKRTYVAHVIRKDDKSITKRLSFNADASHRRGMNTNLLKSGARSRRPTRTTILQRLVLY